MPNITILLYMHNINEIIIPRVFERVMLLTCCFDLKSLTSFNVKVPLILTFVYIYSYTHNMSMQNSFRSSTNS